MAFPLKYTIDEAYCKKGACAKCVEVCEYDAIDLKAQSTSAELEVDSVVVATGWKNYNAGLLDGLHYTNFDNVVTNVEFERLIAPSGVNEGKLLRPSDKKVPLEIAFVQCAGSRDENHLPHCSAVCCPASLKHALSIQEKYPESKIKIFYIDLRVAGRNEDFLVKVQNNKNIELIKGKVARVEEIAESKNLVVEAEDILSGRKVKYEADLVVLATGIVPNVPEIGIKPKSSGFFEAQIMDGIYPVACCKKPMDVSASVKDATGAALKVIQS